MADGDHYAAYADVQNKLSNAGIGTAGNTLYDADSLEIALDLSQVVINTYIRGDPDGADVTGGAAVLCKMVQIDLVFMMILQARHIQNNNLNDAGAIQSFWQITPQLTYQHKQLLDIIASNTDGVAFNGYTRTGVVL